MSLPERNTSIPCHLTNQPGAGLTTSWGLRETPDLLLLLFAGIPRLLQSTMVARGVCGWYVGTYLFCFFPGLSSFLFVRRFLGRSRVFRRFRLFYGFPVLSESRFQFPAEETGWKPPHLGCPRVPASRQLAHPGSKPSHLGCPWLSASRQMAHPGSKPFHLEAGSGTTSKGSSGTPRFRRPAGTSLRPELRLLRFDLFYVFGGPGAVASGHTGYLPGRVGLHVLFPGGGKVCN